MMHLFEGDTLWLEEIKKPIVITSGDSSLRDNEK